MLDAAGEVSPLIPGEPGFEQVDTSGEDYAIVLHANTQVIEPQLDGRSALESEKFARTQLVNSSPCLLPASLLRGRLGKCR